MNNATGQISRHERESAYYGKSASARQRRLVKLAPKLTHVAAPLGFAESDPLSYSKPDDHYPVSLQKSTPYIFFRG